MGNGRRDDEVESAKQSQRVLRNRYSANDLEVISPQETNPSSRESGGVESGSRAVRRAIDPGRAFRFRAGPGSSGLSIGSRSTVVRAATLAARGRDARPRGPGWPVIG